MIGTKTFTTAIEESTKVANTPLFSTCIDKMLGFKISEWDAQGEVIKKQIIDGYEDAKMKGLGVQYVSAFRENANLITVGRKAAQYINPKNKNKIKMENDVFWGLLEHSKAISNDQMQKLIAKIIAGEYNNPGIYSMNTLQVIKMLDKNALELFEKVCSLLISEEMLPHILFSGKHNLEDFMKNDKIDFKKLQALQSIGLFLPNKMVHTIDSSKNKKYGIQYFNKILIYKPKKEDEQKMQLPDFYSPSPVGEQILKHLSPIYIENYYNWLKKNYKIRGYKLKE